MFNVGDIVKPNKEFQRTFALLGNSPYMTCKYKVLGVLGNNIRVKITSGINVGEIHDFCIDFFDKEKKNLIVKLRKVNWSV